MARRNSLIGNLTDTQRRLQLLESRPSYTRLASQVVTRTNIRPKTISTDQIENLSIKNGLIGTDEVTNRNLSTNSVTTDNITPGNVTTGTIASSAVTADKIQDSAVTTAKIADSAVTTAKIANSAVTTAKIADGNVTTAKIAGSAVTTDRISDGAITTAKLAFAAVTTSKIGAGQVSTDNIGQGQVRTFNIDFANITRQKMAANSVGDIELINGNVTNAKLANGAVTTSKIGDGEVTRAKINFSVISSITAGTAITVGGTDGSPTVGVNYSVLDLRYARTSHNHSGTTGASAHPTYSITTGQPPNQTTIQVHSHDFFAGSTRTIKKDISTYEFDTSKLLKTTLVRFKYLNAYKDLTRNAEWEYGYIAEDFEEVGLEEPLAYNSDGQPNRINYSLIGVLTLELVKEQQNRIEALEKTISEMKKEVMDNG